MINFVEMWVYLSGSPLLWLTATLIAYLTADHIAARLGRHPLANPALMAVILVSAVLLATNTPFPAYFAGAQFVHFLLGPATVALAVPLVRHLRQVRRTLIPMAAALLIGSATAIVSARCCRKPSAWTGPSPWHWRQSPPPRQSPWALPKKSVPIRRSPRFWSSSPALPAPLWWRR
jgi:hypothetical protein